MKNSMEFKEKQQEFITAATNRESQRENSFKDHSDLENNQQQRMLDQQYKYYPY